MHPRYLVFFIHELHRKFQFPIQPVSTRPTNSPVRTES